MTRLLLFNKPYGVLCASSAPRRGGSWNLAGLAPAEWREISLGAPPRGQRRLRRRPK
jgi:16S rRNA U516 pseudouridylate synthase RsuA-like enzyme